MSMRKVFWNLGGKLPVWLVHPGQIILLVERKLGATLFKGATLPAWWTPNIMPMAIFLAGMAITAVMTISFVYWVADEDGSLARIVEALPYIGFLAAVFGLALGGAAVSCRFSTIWPWRHLRVAVCTVGERQAACKIAREPCAFTHADGTGEQERYVHWFWGPTLGSRDWKFCFRSHAAVGNETNHSLMIVSDRTGESMSFTIHEMVDVDNIYPWRGQYLYGAHAGMAMSWFDLLHRLFVRSSTELAASHENAVRLSDALHLARIEVGAWEDVIGCQLAYYLECGRSTRADKEIALRLRKMAIDVVHAYMKHVRGLERPDHDPDKLEELFEAMNWPPLVGARRKKRGPGEHPAYVEPAADESR